MKQKHGVQKTPTRQTRHCDSKKAHKTLFFRQKRTARCKKYLSLQTDVNASKTTNMGKLINEFKQFAVKGNAVDMAVGVIIGGAFGKIVSSIVNDLIMPPIGWLIGGVNFTDLKVTLPEIDMGIEKLAPATINYGNFIQTTFDFLIISICVFLMLRAINKLVKKNEQAQKDAEAAKPAEPSKEEKLLTEIRDLLKQQAEKKA